MRRPHALLGLAVVAGLVSAACAAPSPTGAPSQSNGGAPSAVASVAPEPTQPGAEPSVAASVAPEPSEPGGGGGGTGLTLPDGPWSAGTAHLVVSGDATGTYDADLFPTLSITDGGNTTLVYMQASTQIGVALYADHVALSVITADLVTGGGTTVGADCEATFARSDATNVEGTIRCGNVPGITTDGATGKTFDLEASFNATR